MTADVVCVVVVLIGEHQQYTVGAEVVHRPPDQSILKQANMGLVQKVAEFFFSIV